MRASRPCVGGTIIIKACALLWRVAAHRGDMEFAPDRRESGSRFADRRLEFCAPGGGFHCSIHAGNRRIQCKITNREFCGTKREYAEGKIKEHGTMSPMFWKLSLSAHCLGGALAAPHFLPPWCHDFAQSLGFAGFRPAPWPPNVRFFGSFGRDATMSGGGKIASGRSLIFLLDMGMARRSSTGG